MLNHLSDKLLISIKGDDRYNFLQGLITNDINILKENKILYALILNPQGKYFCDLFLYEYEDIIYAEISRNRKEEIIRKFNMYKLRSKVEIQETDKKIFWSNIENDSFFYKDPRSNNMGFRSIDFATDLALSSNDYEQLRIDNFLPEGDKDLIAGNSFPLEYKLDNFNAFSFKKGCYVGQEVVARIHYKGEIRKEIVQVESSDSLPSLGSELVINNQKLGIFLSSTQKKGLALIKTQIYKEIYNNDAMIIKNHPINIIFKESN